MSKMDKLSREQLEQLVDILTDLCLDFAGAQLTEDYLRDEGFENEELKAIGFDVEV